MISGKELRPVDHSKINYEAFRKNMYIETREIAELTDEDVKILRHDLGDTTVRGVECPKPIMTFY
jgi:ATP-dependent RNA helicase DDX46/PRP5